MEISIATKIFIAVFVAFFTFFITGKIIGSERKALWFRKRKRYSIFTKRGPIGEVVHFGYPCTKQGVVVTILMLICIALSSLIIYLL